MRRLLVALAIALLAGTLPAAARGEGVRHPPPDQLDPYRSMTRPGHGGSCCSRSDCGVAVRCALRGQGLGYVEDGRCWPLPPDRYVPAPVELGQSADLHVCRAPVRGVDGRLIGVQIFCWTDSFGT